MAKVMGTAQLFGLELAHLFFDILRCEGYNSTVVVTLK
jgi:hypothetical protein